MLLRERAKREEKQRRIQRNCEKNIFIRRREKRQHRGEARGDQTRGNLRAKSHRAHPKLTAKCKVDLLKTDECP